MNRFLYRHPIVGTFILVGGLVGIIVIGGNVAEHLPVIVVPLVLLVVLILGMMALAGNRHLS